MTITTTAQPEASTTSVSSSEGGNGTTKPLLGAAEGGNVPVSSSVSSTSPVAVDLHPYWEQCKAERKGAKDAAKDDKQEEAKDQGVTKEDTPLRPKDQLQQQGAKEDTPQGQGGSTQTSNAKPASEQATAPKEAKDQVTDEKPKEAKDQVTSSDTSVTAAKEASPSPSPAAGAATETSSTAPVSNAKKP